MHNYKIEETTNNSIINFITSFKYDKIYQLNELIKNLDISDYIKNILLEYIKNNNIHSRIQFTYAEILEPVLYYIINHQDKIELLKILEQEIQDSIGKCFQGRMARTINILNGYDNNIKIQISDNEQISNIIVRLKKNNLELNEIIEIFIKEMKDYEYSENIIMEWIEYIKENL